MKTRTGIVSENPAGVLLAENGPLQGQGGPVTQRAHAAKAAQSAAKTATKAGKEGSQQDLPTALIYDPAYKKHLTGPMHPETPRRCDAIIEALEEAEFRSLLRLSPRPASEEDILLCHGREYYETVRRETQAGREALSTGDTAICRESFDVALLAAGGAVTAVDAVIRGQARNAFCVVRPPGHHATAERGMGFCVFNNAAVAARYAQRRHGIGRVLIADWDVHHGNGTQEIFYDDPSVFFFSTHQWPLYPGTGRPEETGAGGAAGTTVNCPFPAGAGREEILGAFRRKLVPEMESFRPELVIVSAGFDSRKDDLLGSLTLEDEDFAELTRLAASIARHHAQGRLVSVLEGGYNLPGLASAAAAHVRALMKA